MKKKEEQPNDKIPTIFFDTAKYRPYPGEIWHIISDLDGDTRNRTKILRMVKAVSWAAHEYTPGMTDDDVLQILNKNWEFTGVQPDDILERSAAMVRLMHAVCEMNRMQYKAWSLFVDGVLEGFSGPEKETK